jgi:Domain of Unknown Function with PDB structure (DUF3862)
MRLRILKMVLAGWLLGWVFFAAGCSKLSQENYNRLKIGMSYDDVVAVLGEPGECNSAVGFKNCRWGDEKKYINIQFAGQKVVFYSGEGLK